MVRRWPLLGALLLGCGGDESSSLADASAAAPVDAGSDAADAAGMDASHMDASHVEAGPGTEGGADAGPEAGNGSRTSLTCGTAECAEAGTPPDGPLCCAGAGVAPACVGTLAGCESNTPYFCNDDRNCPAGQHCCESSVRDLFSCSSVADCSGRVQLCHASAECLNGVQCVSSTCNGQPLGTCGPLPDAGGTRLRCL
jgi:hypothetical protein